MSFPETLDNLPTPVANDSDPLSSPNHVDEHDLERDAINALEAKVGIDGSAVTTTLDYKLTNPAQVSPGHLHVINDIQGLQAALDAIGSGTGGGTKIAISTVQAVVAASTTSTIYSVAIPGNNLRTSNAIRYRILISALANDAGNASTVNIKYGATTVSTFTYQVNTANSTGYIEGFIIADGSVSAQKGQAWMVLEKGSTSSGSASVHSDYGTATEDSTVSQNLQVEVITGVAGGLTAEAIVVEGISTSGSASEAKTLSPAFALGSAGYTNLNVSTNTVGSVGQIIVTLPITVNKLSFYSFNAANATGTVKIGIYSEDGQTKMFETSITTPNNAAAKVTGTVSAVLLNPGVYYIVAIPVGSTAANIQAWDFTNNQMNQITSEPIVNGTIVVTAGTMPTSFNPVSDITPLTAGKTTACRLDN